jgi:predicted Holliday junction resolvase-like endonuclease
MIIIEPEIITYVTVIFIALLISHYIFYRLYRSRVKKANTAVGDLEMSLQEECAKSAKILSQKKSSEVRTGRVLEKMAPFLADFEHDPIRCHFLGQPIDFIAFEEDGIHFIEVKSGKASLSAAQKRIKQQIKDKKIYFQTYKVRGD